MRLLAAVILLTFALGVAAAAPRLAVDDATGAPEQGRVISTRGGIGPLPGTAVAPYLRDRTAALAEARGRRAAVVSFTTYRSSDEARAALRGTEVLRLLVAVPGGRPGEVESDADLAALIVTQRAEAAAEKRALEQLLPTVEDPDFRRQYEDDIARLGRLLDAPAVIRQLVFGAVIRGPADGLRELAGRPGIRLVDVGASAAGPAPASASGLRPEETVRAEVPPTRPS